MSILKQLARQLRTGKLTTEQFTKMLVVTKSRRFAQNRTFNNKIKVRHNFGSGGEREYKLGFSRPAVFSRMMKYGK